MMCFSRFSLVLAATTATSCSSPSVPVGGPPGFGASPGIAFVGTNVAPPVALVFTSFDTSGDYLVSKAEVIDGARREAIAADRDQNGQLSGFEINDWMALALGDRSALPSFASFDADINGVVTDEEVELRLITMFESLDLNHDNSLSRSEMLSEPVRMMQGPLDGGPGRPPSGRGHPPGGGGPSGGGFPQQP